MQNFELLKDFLIYARCVHNDNQGGRLRIRFFDFAYATLRMTNEGNYTKNYVMLSLSKHL